MLRWITGTCAVVLLAAPALAEEVAPPPSKRFGTADTKETASFQRHVMPLLGRLGCNGRACHGSFQGQGGFRLSLFGYDFQKDHEALAEGSSPRLDIKDPAESLILKKPTLALAHKGGKRLQPGSWQFHALQRWIQKGAVNDATETTRLTRLSVSPENHVFQKQGDTVQLQVIARWSDGTAEDVTELTRFRSNNDGVATIGESGLVTAVGKGDTHMVAFYDNGVTPVPIVFPVSDRVGSRYPETPAPTKIDQLVAAKLRQCGIVPSELSTDTEFLRRVSIDLTGTMPGVAEIEAFVADRSADKRARKIDELLSRPSYAIWWATRLCDYTGNSGLYRDARFGPDFYRQWYDWMHRRVKENVSYDKIVAGLILGTSRKPGQGLEEYSREMSSYYRPDSPADFSLRETMPHFWSRTSLEDPKEKALGFTYSFLGIHLQCAQCHKHPFDQWTKKDFDQFTLFFDRIVYGTPPQDREQFVKMTEAVIPPSSDAKGKGAEVMFSTLVREGKVIPWREVYIGQPGDNGKIKGPVKPGKTKPTPPRRLNPKLLGDAELPLDAPDDLRGTLMTWLRRPDNPYFARAFVNRVWAGYFNVGIIEPADDLSLANPPSNAPLLDHLTRGFVEHGYDMKWLHREIANSRTYQLSWKPNETNRLDARNFSHAMPRRLPAEVAYDAIYQATATAEEVSAWQGEAGKRSIGVGMGANPRTKGKYGNILTVFGKPDRLANCDCERANDPSLLQTLFLLNDAEIQNMLIHPGGWVGQQARVYAPASVNPGKKGAADPAEEAVRAKVVANLERRIQELQKSPDAGAVEDWRRVLQVLKQGARPAEQHKALSPAEEQKLIREAYLRTVCRLPTEKEVARAQDYFKESESLDAGLRDLLWALINTNEFLVNH
jgi:Protein of unknown function (DUF1549)/Protein of unknown function (DUF1553)/Bacterial Ig-like domain (group 2)